MGLGSSFKKAIGKVAKVVAPMTAFTTDLFNSGKSSGPANPYSAPNLKFLQDTSKLDFLKDPSRYNYLKDPSEYQFLLNNTPTNQYAANLPNNLSTFSNTYTDPGDNTDAYFSDLLGSIGQGPTSTDQVYNELDSDLMSQILQGIDVDTKKSVGSLKSDFADRGLSGPGMISDIEATGLAQAYGDADTRRASTRTDFATKQLDRIRQREAEQNAAKQAAYQARFGAGVQQGAQARDIASRGAMTDVAAKNEALQNQAALEEQALGRKQQRELSYADLLRAGEQAYAQTSGSDADLWANLLNARDLGMAGQSTTLFNAGADRKLAGTTPSILESILRNVNIGIGFGG